MNLILDFKMKRKPIPAFDFIEQIIAKTIAEKEGKKLKPKPSEHWTLIVNPFIYESEHGCY